LGGLFTRRAQENHYAHIFMGGGSDSLTYNTPIQASGKVVLTSQTNFNNNIFIGHRSSSLSDFSFLGLMVAEFSATHNRYFAAIQSDDGVNYLGGPLLVPVGSIEDFSYSYNPAGGSNGLGQLTLSISGAVTGTASVDVTALQRSNDAIFLNAFGIGTPNTFSQQSDNQAILFVDNVTYTSPNRRVVR
jgi:hypothetical protein